MAPVFKKILYFGLALLLFGCRSQEQQSIAPPNYEGPDQEGWNSRITVTSSGRITAIVQYSHMEKYSKRREVKFDGGIVVDFFNAEGRHTSNLVAERGRLYEETNDVEALGNVVAVSDSGITLRTQRLRWDNAQQKIFTTDFVTIATAQGDTLYGQGFQSDQNLKNWSIGKPSGVTQKRIDLTGETKKSNIAASATSDSSVPRQPVKDEKQK
ncbi:MAG: LPS export ABC transporter periplasmic protein LptC [candidate division KSB1 bacterium]|nr:LPS export ABC transporter periplasmic protein LptC [candidate division KSB1 bacterium]MDZ7301645.1 LPS export ABC transporter periplasmic protein LptC [candidate division KSB1 bacterium]MDZ7313494.1 LPS export ABC transporter periplasmic protein LptC [candidate division KSB1 bacterium]